MQINEYQEKAITTAVYPKTEGYMYLTLGLVNEAGEVAGKVKKDIRGDYDTITQEEVNQMVADELGDVLWYLSCLARQIGYTLEEIAQMNLDKLQSRKNRDVLKGNGDNR